MNRMKHVLMLAVIFVLSGCTLTCQEVRDRDGDGVLNLADKCEGTPFGVVVYLNGCPVDADGDFVPDYTDECPETPFTVENIDDRGCPQDGDGDGVPDYADACPDTPRSLVVSTNGCPADADKDGVPDYTDLCPDTASATWVDENGCTFVAKRGAIPKRIHFDFDSATIRRDARVILNEAAGTLKSSPGTQVRIVGHADSTGAEQYNLGLSQKRGEVARDYLVSQGIALERLEVVGKGEGSPVASNDTGEGRSQNRRAEFLLVTR